MEGGGQVAIQRVAMFVPSLGGGGAERVALTLALGLEARGMSVEVIVAKSGGPLWNDARARLRITELGSHRTFLSWISLARHLRRTKPDILISHLTRANVVAWLAARLSRLRIPLVAVEHSTISIHRQTWPLALRTIGPLVVGWIYRTVDAVVAVSCGAAQDAQQTLRLPRSVIPIYNPITVGGVPGDVEVPHPWLADPDTPTIIAVGRLEPEKDFSTLIRAFALLRGRRNAKLIILGRGSEAGKLDQLIGDLHVRDDVTLAGFSSDPFRYIRHADVLALTSRYEGFGNVLVEAMQLGIPVVSTDCPGGPREILDGGRYGMLTPVGDPRAMADALEATIAHPVASNMLKVRGCMFSVRAAVDAYVSLITCVAGAPSTEPRQ